MSKQPTSKFINLANIEPTPQDLGNWQIRSNGDLVYTPRNYVIAKDRLAEPNWIIHMAGKVWIDFNEFIPAYMEALRRAGIKELNIITHY